MSPRWLVDGMNLIGSRPTGWWRDRPRAMRELVEQLSRFTAVTGDQVTVVFDGDALELEGGPGVEVRFARRRGRDAADDDIAELAEEGVRVVTSDRRLAERARAAGAEVEGVRAFRAFFERS